MIKDYFVDLKNQTDPYQSFYRSFVIGGSNNLDTVYPGGDMYFQYNEVTFDDSNVGLLEKEAGTEYYFSYNRHSSDRLTLWRG